MIQSLVDLHMHSRHSDGIHSPADLVAMASKKRLQAIALADHDAVAGIDEALEVGDQLGVEVIPAVELSVEFNTYHDVHLLGYFIDHRDDLFLGRLSLFRERREARGKAIIDKINAKLKWEGQGSICYDEVAAAAEGALGRPHIARALIGKGVVTTMQEAFTKYLIPCDMPKLYFPMAEALAEIKRIGGIAVLAHPTSITDDRRQLRAVITELAAMGLEGIEVFNNLCFSDDKNFLESLATELGLVMTGGSDFHGSEPDIQMGCGRGGLAVPYSLVTVLKELRDSRLPPR